MNAKNLALKFAALTALVVICIWTLWVKPMPLGQDLAGGHQMIFKVNISDEDQGRKQYIIREVVEVLGKRLDPDNLRDLTIRPYGSDSIEIRMPAGSKASRLDKVAYIDATKILRNNNIDEDELLTVMETPKGPQRDMKIAKLVKDGGDQLGGELSQLLISAANASDALDRAESKVAKAEKLLTQARQALTKVKIDTPEYKIADAKLIAANDVLTQAKDVSVDADATRIAARKKVMGMNIMTSSLEKVLRLYVSVNERKAIRRESDKAEEIISKRQSEYTSRRKMMLLHPVSLKVRLARESLEKANEILTSVTPDLIGQKNYISLLQSIGTARKDFDDLLDENPKYNDAYQALEQARDALTAIPKDQKDSPQYQSAEKAVATAQEKYTALEKLTRPRGDAIATVTNNYEKWADSRGLLDDPSDLIRLVAKAGRLDFRMAPVRPEKWDGKKVGVSYDKLNGFVEQLKTEGAESSLANADFGWYEIEGDAKSFGNLIVASDQAGDNFVLLSNESAHTMLADPTKKNSWELARAYPTSDQMGAPAVGFEFDVVGARRFHRLTSKHRGEQMAILLDDKASSAPNINDAISQSGIISGSFTPKQVNEMVRLLNAGTLKARIDAKPTSETTFDPLLGKAHAAKGTTAAYIGLAAVATFMLFYYLLPGLIANIALVLNIILVLGSMVLMEARFTLPGIAGLILTIGIAVDANVLIFERLREEQAKGQSIRLALKAAYEKAFTAILDANLTTLITCVILGWIGTPAIKGFAITLALGVVFSLFTALVLTRWIFQLLLDRGIIKNQIKMLKFVRVPKVNWLAKRRIFWGISIVMVVMGLVSLGIQGGDLFGIDFLGGTQTRVTFKDDAIIKGELLDGDTFLTEFKKEAIVLGYEKLAATAAVITQEDEGAAERMLGKYDTDKDRNISIEEWAGYGSSDASWSKLIAKCDADSNGILSAAELATKPSSQLQLTSTEVDVTKLRDVLNKGFASVIVTRGKLEYEFITGMDIENLGINISSEDGYAWIDDALVRNVASEKALNVKNVLRKHKGGVIFAVSLSGKAGVTEDEIVSRIDQVRIKSVATSTDVRGIRLAEEGRNKFNEFIILIGGGTSEDTPKDEKWAQSQKLLVSEAIERQESSNNRQVGASQTADFAGRAIMAMLLSWIAIIVYLWIRFGSAQWGLAAVICLIHDVVIVVGLVAVSGWLFNVPIIGKALGLESFKIDLPMIAALLTVIGYSVNDTIVVFDRIRENRGRLTSVNETVINNSINQTLPRTLLTSFTTFVVVFIMYVWGGPGIHAYSFALLVGVIFGTYSSIAIASPLILGFRRAILLRALKARS